MVLSMNKKVDHFIYRMEPIFGHEALKDNLQTFKEAFVLAERFSQLANLIGDCGIHNK